RKPGDIILGGPDKYFDPTAFTIPKLVVLGTQQLVDNCPTGATCGGFLGTAARNFLQGPGQVNLDFSLTKENSLPFLGEGGRLDFRFEVFNIANHANFNIPVAGRTVYTATETAATLTPQPTAGSIERTRSDARKIQF